MARILVFAGSTREGAFSKQLARAGAIALDGLSGPQTSNLIDLADFEAPVYNADLEAAKGLPEPIRSFKILARQHDGMMIATPEYNGCVPPLLVNLFSWASRPEGDEGPSVFHDRPVALMASSPGGLGGVRVVPRLRDMVSELGMIPASGFVSVPHAHSAFAVDGKLADPAQQNGVTGLAERLLAQILPPA